MEVLAPVGNLSSLRAAIGAGADAVYMGLGDFNARAKAENFSEQSFIDAAKLCKIYGIKVYLTMNTLLKPNEIPRAIECVDKVVKFIDAVIVQDLGLAFVLQQKFPTLSLHASTQMGVHNVDGAEFARKLGFKRIILSRETTLSDIKQIKEKVDIEVETFVHGALCVAFSGNCYLSSIVSGYSGNRGKCMQLCRKKYYTDNAEGYLLSAKDVCLLNYVNELASAGVDSIKIEGRLRSPEYVFATVKAYKNALDGNVNENDVTEIKRAFNRGDFCDGYINEPTPNVIDVNTQGNIGLNIGNVVEISGNTISCKLVEPWEKGDGIKFVSHNGKETGNALINKVVKKGENYVTTYVGNVGLGDKVCLTKDNSLKDVNYLELRKLNIKATFTASVGVAPTLTYEHNGITVTCAGNGVCERAQQKPLNYNSIFGCVAKTGGTPFLVTELLVLGEEVFYSLSNLTELRRETIKKLEQAILSKNMAVDYKNNGIMRDIIHKNCIFAPIFNKKIAVIDSLSYKLKEKLYNNFDYVVYNPSEYSVDSCNKFCNTYNEKAVLQLPIIAREDDVSLLKEIVNSCDFSAYVVNNLYGVSLCNGKSIILGSAFNVLNDELKLPRVAPYEIDKIIDSPLIAYYCYGKIPLMNFAHCHNKVVGYNCSTCVDNKNGEIKDELNNVFHMRKTKLKYCYFSLHNGVPTSLIEETSNLKYSGKLYDFTLESDDKILSLIDFTLFEKDVANHTHGNVKRVLR